MRENELLSLLRSIDQHLARIADALCNVSPPRIDVEQTYRRQMAARLLLAGVAISIGALEGFAPHFICALRVGVGYS